MEVVEVDGETKDECLPITFIYKQDWIDHERMFWTDRPAPPAPKGEVAL